MGSIATSLYFKVPIPPGWLWRTLQVHYPDMATGWRRVTVFGSRNWASLQGGEDKLGFCGLGGFVVVVSFLFVWAFGSQISFLFLPRSR